ncbi:MAG TPA: hypothetical protein VN670_06835, partial [Acidobacteriaceae bacterium]|nr:hypothetical protein [Acidobacteriaceae bacterium]
MVDVLNSEHIESKTLNTTELEAHETATAAPEVDAFETNHNISASAEHPPVEQPYAEAAVSDETATPVTEVPVVAGDTHTETPPEPQGHQEPPQGAVAKSEDSAPHEEEMD